jgi:hypothetical protein
VNYYEFEARIKRLVSSASESARFRFAHDTILLLHRSAAALLSEEMTEDDRRLLHDILAKIDIQSTLELKEKLGPLHDAMCVARALEAHPDITELLGAIHNWLEYRATRNPHFIERMAVNMVNSLDYYIGGDSGAYSTDNILAAAEMREEFHRQEHFLARQ